MIPVTLGGVEIANVPQVEHALQAWATRLHHLRDGGTFEHRAIVFTERLKKWIRWQFVIGGDPPWAPLRPGTLAGSRSGRPLGGVGGSIFKRTRTVLLQHGTGAYQIDVATPQIGVYHQQGRKGPWDIYPKNARVLAFAGTFASSTNVVSSKTGRPLSARSAAKAIKGSAHMVYSMHVRHPGYPARPFARVSPELVHDAWTQPWKQELGGKT